MRRCVLVSLVVFALSSFQVASSEASDPSLKPLIENAGLTPWTYSKHPKVSDFEFPDSRNVLRSLARDYKGKVALIYMFAEW